VQVCLSAKSRHEPDGESAVHVEAGGQQYSLLGHLPIPTSSIILRRRCAILSNDLLASWCKVLLTVTSLVDRRRQRDHYRAQPCGHSATSFSGDDRASGPEHLRVLQRSQRTCPEWHLVRRSSSGLPAGAYRMCSINSSTNHQPVLVNIAQHGSLDDCVYVSHWCRALHPLHFLILGGALTSSLDAVHRQG
jgi:hypothetical protein